MDLGVDHFYLRLFHNKTEATGLNFIVGPGKGQEGPFGQSLKRDPFPCVQDIIKPQSTLTPFDGPVKNQKFAFPVIPANAGTQGYQLVGNVLAPGFHRGDDFLPVHHIWTLLKKLDHLQALIRSLKNKRLNPWPLSPNELGEEEKKFPKKEIDPLRDRDYNDNENHFHYIRKTWKNPFIDIISKLKDSVSPAEGIGWWSPF
jgi:hypothetical protein